MTHNQESHEEKLPPPQEESLIQSIKEPTEAPLLEITAQTELALRESEERYRLLVDAVTEYAIFMMDNSGRILTWNLGVKRVLGYSEAEFIGQHTSILFTPEDRAADIDKKELEVATVAGRALDDRWTMRKGEIRFWASGVTTALFDQNGQLRGFSKIVRDKTDEKLVEERLRNAYDELEQQVIERTQQLSRINASLQKEIVAHQKSELERQQLLQRVVASLEDERRRISRELHDQMGQQLTALLLGLKSLPAWPASHPLESAYQQQLVRLHDLTRELMQQMHRLAWELRPAILDTIGLEAALRQHVMEWAQRCGLQADFASRGVSSTQRLPPDLETALYRVVQEALVNVQRHAEAQAVSVILERVDSNITAIVEDDGKGFPLDEEDSESDESASAGIQRETLGNRLGLLGMRERMELVGGTLTIESTPGQGTTIYARASIKANSEPHQWREAAS